MSIIGSGVPRLSTLEQWLARASGHASYVVTRTKKGKGWVVTLYWGFDGVHQSHAESLSEASSLAINASPWPEGKEGL